MSPLNIHIKIIWTVIVLHHEVNPNRDGSYTNSPHWIKNKKATINLINKKDNKCFKYAVTVMLNHEEIKSDPPRVTKINLNKAGFFESSFFWGMVNLHVSLHISRRTYLISIKFYTIID